MSLTYPFDDFSFIITYGDFCAVCGVYLIKSLSKKHLVYESRNVGGIVINGVLFTKYLNNGKEYENYKYLCGKCDNELKGKHTNEPYTISALLSQNSPTRYPSLEETAKLPIINMTVAKESDYNRRKLGFNKLWDFVYYEL